MEKLRGFLHVCVCVYTRVRIFFFFLRRQRCQEAYALKLFKVIEDKNMNLQ